MPAGTTIVPDTTIVNRRPSIGSEEDWQRCGEVSPIVQMSQNAVAMSQTAEKIQKAPLRPTVALRVEDNFNGPITIEVPPIDSNLNYWYAGIGISYNIGSLYKQRKKLNVQQASTAKAKADYLNTLHDTQARIHAAFVKYNEAVNIRQTRQKSVQLAYENYDVVHYRYLNGMALITDMLDAQNQKISAELQLTNAEINIAYSHYMLLASVGRL